MRTSKRGHPRREVILLAFARAQEGIHAAEIDLTPLSGMNVDTTALIISKTEAFRDADLAHAPPTTYHPTSPVEDKSILHAQVVRACRASGLPPARQRAYQIVVMNYYGLIREFQAANRKARAEPKKETVAA